MGWKELNIIEKRMNSLNRKIEYIKRENDELRSQLIKLQQIKDIFYTNKEEAIKFFAKKHNINIDICDVEFSAWTQTFNGTNSFSGNMISDHIIFCWRNKIFNDCILILNDHKQYHKQYKPFIVFQTN